MKKSSSLSFYGALVLSFNNFRQRFWRNVLISLATSIGLIGVFVALSLGNGINSQLQSELDSGSIPTQVQVSLNYEKVKASSLSYDDKTDIEELVGASNITYFEFPFSATIAAIQIGQNQVMNFEESMPAYCQTVSLYEDPNIQVSSNTPDEVLAGNLYTDSKTERGLTVPLSFLNAYNELNGTKLEPADIVGQKVKLKFLEATAEEKRYFDYETVISRVISDEFEDSNSFMGADELRGVIESAGFTLNLAHAIFQLNDPALVKDAVSKINETGRYVALSQIDMLDKVMLFIKIIQGLLAVFSLQAIVVSVVMIGVIIYINIQERTREIGVFKAVGYDNGSIRRIFIYEALYLMGLAYLFSLLVSFATGGIVNSVVSEKLPSLWSVYVMSPQIILGILAFPLVAGWLAAYIPSRRISKMDPVESLRTE